MFIQLMRKSLGSVAILAVVAGAGHFDLPVSKAVLNSAGVVLTKDYTLEEALGVYDSMRSKIVGFITAKPETAGSEPVQAVVGKPKKHPVVSIVDMDVSTEPEFSIISPVTGVVTNGFGERIHPILGTVEYHKGVDIAAPLGTPVMAAMDGTVDGAGEVPNLGKRVILLHSEGRKTVYGHLSTILVKAGDEVKKGDTIGQIGTTGLSTGPHLHFELWLDGSPKDPKAYFKFSGQDDTSKEKALKSDP